MNKLVDVSEVEPVAEVVEDRLADWSQPFSTVKWHVTEFDIGTKLYTSPPDTIQNQVAKWMLSCFGEGISKDVKERNHRFLEEAVELVQSKDCTRSEAHQLVDYVFDRPIGEPKQEVGGVMVTLAALCNANDIDMVDCANTEIARIWTKVEQIREKQANKPKHSPLPQDTPDTEAKLKRAVEALNILLKDRHTSTGNKAFIQGTLKDIGD